jgi:putative nucleotidyltransferase with HDIG domain
MAHAARAPIAAAIVAAAIPLATLTTVGSHTFTMTSTQHCLIVGIAAAIATAAAYAVTAIGVRRRDARTVLVGSAFGLMGATLAVHGLVTVEGPFESYWLGALSGGASLPLGAAALLLTGVPALCQTARIRGLLVANVAALTTIVVVTTVGITFPEALPSLPAADSPLAVTLLVAGEVSLALVALRALRTFVLTRRSADLLVLVGLAWLGAAMVGALLMTWMELGWWLGHGLEVAGILAVAGSVAIDLQRTAGSRPLNGDLRAVELVRAAEDFLGARVQGLLGDLATKDRSTEEHTRRVALLAVAVGEELGLRPSALRALAEGGLLHDIGKLAVPTAILRKPAKLTDEEYASIKRHPGDGERLLRQIGGFPEDVRALVLDHHERLDGSGYPNGKRAEAISLPARIMATCDVFDALVSPRVYRDAWPVERALTLLRAETGTSFDARCVEALERVVTVGERDVLADAA